MYHPKSAAGQIRGILNLFGNKKRWIKGDFARTAPEDAPNSRSLSTGDEVRDLRATPQACWCLVGGAQYVAGTSDNNEIAALTFIQQAIIDKGYRKKLRKQHGSYEAPSSTIITFNDAKERYLSEVRQVLLHALELAERAA